MVDRVLDKFGLIRAGSKSFERLWAMAQESKLFQGQVSKEYAQIPTVYKSIKAITDNVNQARLKFYRVGSDEEIENDKDLMRLFQKRPNPLMSFSALLEATILYHRLCGETFWVFEKSIGQAINEGKGLPAEIWTFNPKCFKEQIDRNTRQLMGWKCNNEFYTVEQVMHFKDMNPYNELRGLSPLDPAKYDIDIDWFSMIYNRAFFQNDATPGYTLSTDQSLNKTQRERLEQWLNENYRGATNAFKVAILEAGLKPVSTTHTNADMQFIDQKKYIREDLIGMWRVPKTMLGITEDLNYATFVGQKKVFWTDTIIPILERLAEEINSQFFDRFMPDVYCAFDFSGVLALQEDIKERSDVAQRFFNMGVPFNMINERLNLGFDEIPGGDIGYLPFSLVPAEMAGSQIGSGDEEDPDEGEEDEEDEPKKLMNKASIDEASEKMWKGFVKLHEQREQKFAGAVGSYLYQQRARVLAGLKGDNKQVNEKLIEFFFDWGREAKVFKEKIRPFINSAIFAGVDFARGLTPANLEEQILEGHLRSYLEVRVVNLTGVSDRIQKRVEKEITTGIQLGESIGTISTRLRSFYNKFTPFASLRIARTEVTAAMNGGSLEYYKAIGARTKTWLSAADEHVRESHRELHGQTVGINNKFNIPSNGYSLDKPGDSDAPASEVVNCRCTMVTRETFGS